MPTVRAVRVINNGYASKFFKLQRGVRQGCPLSGSLFVLCPEILANAIRTDKSIKGIQIYDKEFKISQYADDTTAFVSDTNSAQFFFQLLDSFKECSGLEVDKAKQKACGLVQTKITRKSNLTFLGPNNLYSH